MLTDTLKKIMNKQSCTEVVAKRLLKITEILKLIYKLCCTYEVAEIVWQDNKGKAGVNCEETLVRLFKSWKLKSRRLPRSGNTSKKTKRPRTTPVKPCDIKLTVDNSTILIESKLRSSPKALYDDIQKNPACYLVHHENHHYYVLHQEAFRKLLVDLIPSVIIESNRGIKFYHDLFNETSDKARHIDIVTLKQKTFDYCFLIRPNTYNMLVSRCTQKIMELEWRHTASIPSTIITSEITGKPL